MNSLHPTLRSSIATILILAAVSTPQGNAQTNIPTDRDSVVTGTFKAGPTTVIKGENAESSSLSTAVNIAATVRQVVEGALKTNSSGVVTRKDSFKKYAFGNKEILQLTLSNAKPRGYSLAYTDNFDNSPGDSGAFIARGKSNSIPVTLVKAAFYTEEDVAGIDSNSKTGKWNYDGYVWTRLDIGFYTNLPLFASYKLTYPTKVDFGAGTNKTTDSYSSLRANGSFSGIIPEAD